MDIGKNLEKIMLIILGAVVVFYMVGGMASTFLASLTNISGSGLPFAGLFASNGPIPMLFMAGLIIWAVVHFMSMGKHKKK